MADSVLEKKGPWSSFSELGELTEVCQMENRNAEFCFSLPIITSGLGNYFQTVHMKPGAARGRPEGTAGDAEALGQVGTSLPQVWR